MFPLRSLVRYAVLVAFATCLAPLVVAQDPPVPESPQAIKAAMEEHARAIAATDPSTDAPRAINLRMALAALSKPREAQALYTEALAIADSAELVEEELAARQALASTLAARGQMKQAYEEALRVAEHTSEWSARQLAASGAKVDSIMRSVAVQRDSLMVAAEAGRQNAEGRVNEANEDARSWMWVAVGVCAVALAAIVLMLVMNGRALRRQRAEIQNLRSDLRSLEDRSRNRIRGTAAPEVAPPTTSPAEPEPTPVVPPPVVDPLVRAMFHKQAPERMATLQAARAGGDHEKVQRVVHTLKPQLAHFDPLFAGLCARITEVRAWNDPSRWTADLDALAAAVARILQEPVTPGSPTA